MNDHWTDPEGRDDIERRFLAVLRERICPLHVDIWIDRPQLVTSVDIDDHIHAVTLRTLRVEFDGVGIRGGNDPTHQLIGELDPADPDWFERTDCATPEACAKVSAAFYKEQAERLIDREEWDVLGAVTYRWTLVDVGWGLATAGNIPARAPDRVRRITSGS